MQWEALAGMHVTNANYENGVLFMDVLNGSESVELCWSPMGDCCSTSWIEHFEGVENLPGQTILEVWSDYGPREEDHPEHDCLQVYFYKLRTTAGYVDIDMRNSSNGFYGGWLECSESAEHIARYVSKEVIDAYKKKGER